MSRARRKIDEMMLDGASEEDVVDALASDDLAYEPEAYNPNMDVRLLVDDYIDSSAQPAPAQSLATPPDPVDDDAWIGEMASRFSPEQNTQKSQTIPRGTTTDIRPSDAEMARREAERIWDSGNNVWSVVGNFLNPAGAPAAMAQRRAEVPIKMYQEAQRGAQEARRDQREREQFERNAPLAERRVSTAEQNAARGDRGENRRWLEGDPRSEWSEAENAEYDRRQNEAARRTRERDVFTGNTAADRRTRGVINSGDRGLMRQEGVLAGTPAAPQTQQAGIADTIRMRYEEAGIEITPRLDDLFEQLARADKKGGTDNTRRNQLIGQLDEFYTEHQKRTSGAASEFGKDLDTTGIAAADDAYEEAMQSIRNATGPDGTIAGFGTGAKLARNIAGAVSPDLGREAQIAVGGEGAREVVTAIERFIAAEIFRFSGKAATNQERAFYMRMIPDSVFADSSELTRWVSNIGAQIQRDKERLAQTHGVEGVETFAGRGRGASAAIRAQTELREQAADPQQVVPAPQPGRRIERGGRRYTVVP